VTPTHGTTLPDVTGAAGDEIAAAPSQILLVEDSLPEAFLISRALSIDAPAPYRVTHVRSAGEAAAHLRTEPTDCVLLDLTLPDATGTQTVMAIRSASPTVPVIVLTGLDDDEVAATSVQLGAQDYLLKGEVDSRRLWRSMRYAVIRSWGQQDLQHKAMHDELTGLSNRMVFRQRLAAAVGRLPGDAEGVAVLFIDLDGFKAVNDEYGHVVGDEVLRLQAERLRACLCPNDTAARYGGDEFVVLSDGVEDVASIEVVANRISRALSVPVDLGGPPLDVGASIGIAVATSPSTRPESMLWAADAAMYAAKADPDVPIVVADPSHWNRS
jgi:diguanylate cyclase (GGDEF)-like protein